MSKAFEGIRVIDFTQVLAGPFCAEHLAYMGADVVKVEQRGVGDQTRAMAGNKAQNDLGLGPYFLAMNAGKRSLTLDLKHPRAKEVVHKLIKDADVMLQNFKAGTMERFGFGYDDLKKINPNLIYCSISGFGQKGPKAGMAAYDSAVQGSSGMMTATGYPKTGPTRIGFQPIDMMTGMTAAFAISTALFRRERGGQGEHIDMPLYDTAVTMMSPLIGDFLNFGTEAKLVGNGSQAGLPAMDTFKTQDGYYSAAVATGEQLFRICRCLGLDELAEDESLNEMTEQVRRADEIRAAVSEAFLKQPTDYWAEALKEAKVPGAAVRSFEEAVNDEQLAHRNLFIKLQPNGMDREITVLNTAFTLSEGETGTDRAPPTLGQHSEEVLLEVGFSEVEAQSLITEGVV